MPIAERFSCFTRSLLDRCPRNAAHLVFDSSPFSQESPRGYIKSLAKWPLLYTPIPRRLTSLIWVDFSPILGRLCDCENPVTVANTTSTEISSSWYNHLKYHYVIFACTVMFGNDRVCMCERIVIGSPTLMSCGSWNITFWVPNPRI